jgi:hypothetical protein
MSLLTRIRDFRKRRADTKRRALAKARAKRQNAELELTLDDFAWDGRLPKDAEEGYCSSLSDGYPDNDEPRGDW